MFLVPVGFNLHHSPGMAAILLLETMRTRPTELFRMTFSLKLNF